MDRSQALVSPQDKDIISVETTLAYLRCGWSVIPVILQAELSGKISKRPAVKWQEYQKRLPTEHEVRQWFGERQYTGIGVVTGKVSNLVVIDIEHDATAKDVVGIESPLESQTISGGRHVFYRWTKFIKNAVRLRGKPIDFRGDGGFIVLPPSQLRAKGYTWIKRCHPHQLPELPPQIEAALTSNGKQIVSSTSSSTHRESRGITELVAYSATTIFPHAHEGERNSTAAKVSGRLCANMSPKLWESVGWQALQGWNTSQCTPPLGISELRSVWNSITATHVRGNKQPKGDVEYTSDGVRQSKSKKPITILPWRAFRQQQFAQPKWIVENLIPEKGLIAVAGPPESCKSYFTTYLAIAVARGEVLFDQFPTKRVSVLLVDQENLPVWIQRRLMQFQAEDELPLHIYANRDAPFNLENQDAFSQVVIYLKDHQIGLLVLDTLRLSHTRDENSSTDMKPVFDRLKQLTKYTSVLFIQHHRKGDRRQTQSVHGEDMMGSILIRGSVDYQLSIMKLSDVSEGSTQIKVTQTKARYTKNLKPFILTLEEQNERLQFAYAGPVGELVSKKEQAKDAICELLAEEPHQRRQIIDNLVNSGVCSTRTAEAALAALVASGQITHSESKPRIYTLVSSIKVPQSAKQVPQVAESSNSEHEKSAKDIQSSKPALREFEPKTDIPQTAGIYIQMRSAERDDGKREKAKAIIGSLHSGDLQRRIRATKTWLLENEKCNIPNFDAQAWFRQLSVYQLLIDESQMRGVVRNDDWLEMARMTFHTDDGSAGVWIN